MYNTRQMRRINNIIINYLKHVKLVNATWSNQRKFYLEAVLRPGPKITRILMAFLSAKKWKKENYISIDASGNPRGMWQNRQHHTSKPPFRSLGFCLRLPNKSYVHEKFRKQNHGKYCLRNFASIIPNANLRKAPGAPFHVETSLRISKWAEFAQNNRSVVGSEFEIVANIFKTLIVKN